MINLLVKLYESELLTLAPAKQKPVSGKIKSSDPHALQDKSLLVGISEVLILLEIQ